MSPTVDGILVDWAIQNFFQKKFYKIVLTKLDDERCIVENLNIYSSKENN